MAFDSREFENYLESPVIIMATNHRYITGVFKSFDQYGNFTINYTTVYLVYEGQYAEQKQGLIVLRGDTVMLMGKGGCLSLNGYQKMPYPDLFNRIHESALASDAQII